MMARSKEQAARPAPMVSDLSVEQPILPRIVTSNLPDERITARFRAACEMFGWSRSEMYRRIAAGDIEAVKLGTRTLIVMASVRTFVARLPRAEFRRPQQLV